MGIVCLKEQHSFSKTLILVQYPWESFSLRETSCKLCSYFVNDTDIVILHDSVEISQFSSRFFSKGMKENAVSHPCWHGSAKLFLSIVSQFYTVTVKVTFLSCLGFFSHRKCTRVPTANKIKTSHSEISYCSWV